MKIGPDFFLQHFKNKIVQFCKIYGSKKRKDNKFSVLGSGIRDPGSGSGTGKNQDPGSGINIPDKQHWFTFLPLKSKDPQAWRILCSCGQKNCTSDWNVCALCMSVGTEVEVIKIILMKIKDFWQLAIHKHWFFRILGFLVPLFWTPDCRFHSHSWGGGVGVCLLFCYIAYI